MNISFKINILVFTLLILYSCKQEKQPEQGQVIKTKKDLIRVNKYLVRKDAEIIEIFIKNQEWDMKVTDEGLWYMIYKKGNGNKAKKGKTATLTYSISLLDGTVCYDSDSLGPKKFKIGQGGVESGLESGILMLEEGDKARFIMPPHLAHGLLGDNNKIPPRTIILYDVELLTITN